MSAGAGPQQAEEPRHNTRHLGGDVDGINSNGRTCPPLAGAFAEDRLRSREDRGATQMIRADVPLAQLFGYASALRLPTRGRATFVMQFERYQPVRPGEDDAAEASFVRAPLHPGPAPRVAGATLPEPGDGTAD